MQNKRELINEYKNRKQIGGVCKITNTITSKIYLFTAPDIEAYKNRYEFSKKSGSCVTLKLQSDWNQYGSEAFIFEVVEELEKNVEQSSKEFTDDLNELLAIYVEKFSENEMY